MISTFQVIQYLISDISVCVIEGVKERVGGREGRGSERGGRGEGERGNRENLILPALIFLLILDLSFF